MKHNQNAIVAISHSRTVRFKSHDQSLRFHQPLKKLPVVERLFWQLGTCFSGQRFKQEPMYGLSAGTKNVAVVERWLLLEVRL